MISVCRNYIEITNIRGRLRAEFSQKRGVYINALFTGVYCIAAARKVHRPSAFCAQLDRDDDLRFRSSCGIVVWDLAGWLSDQDARGLHAKLCRTRLRWEKRAQCSRRAFCFAFKSTTWRVFMAVLTQRRLIRANDLVPVARLKNAIAALQASLF